MMRIIAPLLLLLSFACLLAPDGSAIWIEKSQVVSISRPIQCPPASQSRVALANGSSVCVQEDHRAVIKRFEDTK